jgi:dipeptidyl aminopeptidase/acylaminoacyl peptidase
MTASPGGSSSFPGDNGRIAFRSQCGQSCIVAVNPDGTGQTVLSGSEDFSPAWSADGRKLAFASYRDGNAEIYVMNADGTAQRRLTNDPAVDDRPSWSPDGEQITFTSNRDGFFEIFVMDADGSNVRQVTDTPTSVFNGGSTFSPDGRHLAFTSSRDGNDEIFVMDADGSNVRQRTHTAGGIQNEQPSWSPDGEQIAFGSNRDGGFEQIYVMDADGTDVHRLTFTGIANFDPAFSPDGEQIAFVSTRDGETEVYVMNADGTDQRRVTHDLVGPKLVTTWQPLEVAGDVTVTKAVNGTPPPQATYDVKIVCDGGDDTTTKTLTFGEVGGTTSFERDSFGPLKCAVTEPVTGGASTVEITCANAKNAECAQNGEFELFGDPGGDKTKIDITVTNTFSAAPVLVEPTFTG